MYDSDGDGVITKEDWRINGIKLHNSTPSMELEHQQNQKQAGTQRQ